MGSLLYIHIVPANLAVFIVLFVQYYGSRGYPVVDPTQGFTELPLNTSNFHIQKPYELPIRSRYSLINGVHKLWVYSTDHPLSKGSPTKPRTEIFIRGYDYSSGVWQFEGHGYVPSGTSGVCIMQVFGASPNHATTLMLRIPFWYQIFYDRWFRLNVIHDVEASNVKVFIDGIFIHEAPGRGGTSHYFKCGVYAQNDDSNLMESRWKGIRVLKK
ncbi:hypothetical protein UlMin_038012 [Ulmus minor]